MIFPGNRYPLSGITLSAAHHCAFAAVTQEFEMAVLFANIEAPGGRYTIS